MHPTNGKPSELNRQKEGLWFCARDGLHGLQDDRWLCHFPSGRVSELPSVWTLNQPWMGAEDSSMLVYPQHKPAAVRCHLVKLPGFCRLQVQLSRNLKQCTGTKTNYGWFFYSTTKWLFAISNIKSRRDDYFLKLLRFTRDSPTVGKCWRRYTLKVDSNRTINPNYLKFQ